jgi:hypothetical protein
LRDIRATRGGSRISREHGMSMTGPRAGTPPRCRQPIKAVPGGLDQRTSEGYLVHPETAG